MKNIHFGKLESLLNKYNETLFEENRSYKPFCESLLALSKTWNKASDEDKNKILNIINMKDVPNLLTFEELIKYPAGTQFWVEYDDSWNCKVNDEYKSLIEDNLEPCGFNLKGLFCTVGDIKNTINTGRIKVYKSY